jgi:outer membrane phospholipase A
MRKINFFKTLASCRLFSYFFAREQAVPKCCRAGSGAGPAGILSLLPGLALLFIFTAGLSYAGQFAVSLDNDRATAGEKVGLLFISLANDTEDSPDFPAEIICELISQERKFAVPANKDIMEGESGVRQHYSFNLPSELQGQVVVSFSGIAAPRIVLDVALAEKDDTAAEVTEAGTATQTTEDKVYPTLDSMFALSQPYHKNASAYQPVYFLVGADPEESKFQISFKYRIFDSESLLAENNPWIKGLHLGYTQTSFWDLKSSSAPFSDTSYKPEFFWLSKNYLTSEHGLLKGLFFQGGVQHESNGRDEEFSRSTNNLYVKPILVFYDDDSKFGLQLSAKILSYFEDDDNNEDLSDYRGYFDMETEFGYADSFVFNTLFRLADQGASFQLNISYPLDKIFGDALDIYFYAQYTNLLAESLLDFQERSHEIRFGLALIR